MGEQQWIRHCRAPRGPPYRRTDEASSDQLCAGEPAVALIDSPAPDRERGQGGEGEIRDRYSPPLSPLPRPPMLQPHGSDDPAGGRPRCGLDATPRLATSAAM